MVFGFFWILAFLIACNEFVVIVSAITWYYSDKTIPDDDGIPGDADLRTGFWWTLRYHMGSLACGSFILSLVWLIRIVFEYVGDTMHGAVGNNGCTKCCFTCIGYCINCFDRFIRYLNSNAYIYMALSGEDFCSSAVNSFILILKNKAKFAFVGGMADIFMFLAKFFIASMSTVFTWLFLAIVSDVESPYLPLFVVFMIAYMIASIFIAVFEVSSNTILQCYLLDSDIARQSGLANPNHIPATLKTFFKNNAVMAQMGP